MLAFLGLTTVFYCILLLALQGKLADMSAPESSHRGAGEGRNMPDTTLRSTLSVQGWKWEKHGPAQGSKRMVKGLFGEGIQIHLKNNSFFFVVGRSSERAHKIRGLFWDVGPIQSKREHIFGGLYGGDRLQFGGGKVTQREEES